MKKLLMGLFLAAIALTATAQKEIVNDPDAELRTVNGSFTKIKVSHSIDLFISQSETESVAVSATEQKFRDAIKTVVENGTLKIYYDGDKGWNNFSNRKTRAYVSFKTLELLDASGASDIQVSGTITGTSLTLNLSGSSDFKGAVKVSNLKLDLSGASDVRIGGTATTVNIESSGASDIKGYGLAAEICTAKASGASDIEITVNKELNAHASGSSEIFYKGNAVIKEMHSSGSSSISKKS